MSRPHSAATHMQLQANASLHATWVPHRSTKPDMKAQTRRAMEGDTSTDHIESKAIIAKVLYAYFQTEEALREGCTGVDSLQVFTTVRLRPNAPSQG